MGCEEKPNLALSNLIVQKKSKGNLSTEKPIFCLKGSYLVIAIGNSCYLYSTSTGEDVKKLFQCADDIIAYQLHPTDHSLIIAITENGEVTVYNLQTNEIESTVNLKLSAKILKKQSSPKFTSKILSKADDSFDWDSQPLDSLSHRKFIYADVKAYQNNSSNIYIWATWCLDGEVMSHMSVFTFNGKHIGLLNLHKTGLTKCYGNLTVGSIQNLDIFVGMSYNFVHIAQIDIKKKNLYKKHFIGKDLETSCIALHPAECMFATGCSNGKIVLWRNIFEKYPLKDIFHWHHLPVHDIYFSKFGSYMFSGGEENVLVKWSLTTQTKNFLPRLSSTINRITGDSEASLLALTSADNKITVIDFNFDFVSTIQNFSRWFLSKRDNNNYIFTIDYRTNSLVLNGKIGHIQFLSLNDDEKFLYTFDVTYRNFISDGRCSVENTDVTHARFSKFGKWLVTVESRKGGLYLESRLKFWAFCEKENTFALNTNVELPHEEMEIFSLEISPDDKVATTGGDQKFRLWSVFEYQHANQTQEIWALHSVNKYRNLPCSAVDFSKDASLVAVSFGPVLTIWESMSCVLKCSLSVPNKKDYLKYCKFGNNELSHLIVAGTKWDVSCWNTITLSMIWTVPFKLSILISDPFSIYMAAFSEDYSLIVFNPASPFPDFSLKKVSYCPVVAAHCASTENGKFCLYFLTSDQDLFCLGDADRVPRKASANVPKSFLTPYSTQIAEIQNRTESEKGKITLNKSNNQLVAAILDSPAHTLPNPSLLCSDILKGLLVFSTDLSSTNSLKKAVNSESLSKADKNHNFDNLNNANSEQAEKNLLKIVQEIFT